MKKSYILVSISLITALNVFAQNIERPDVTTVIEGDTVTVSPDALPDFKDVLKIPEGSGTIVPVLPDINTDVKESKEKKINVNNNKTVYSEIAVGGGYPFLFFGNVDVKSTNKVSPFALSFDYESANGYNSKPLTDNFSDSLIQLNFEKSYVKDSLSLLFNANYEKDTKGLQKKVIGMSDINKSAIEGFAEVNYSFKNGVSIGSDMDLVLYNRFLANTIDNQTIDTWKNKSDFITFIPHLNFNWQGYGFDFNLIGEYLLDGNLFYSLEGKNVNRGAFQTELRWHNDIIDTFGNVAIVFGNQLKNNKVLFPFSLGLDASFPVYFSNRNVRLSFEGGLLSTYKTVEEIEKEYSYSVLKTVPNEIADWYGKLEIDIPLKQVFSGNFKAEYKKTAFNNGVWEPIFSEDTKDLYEIKNNSHELLTTDLSLTYTSGLFSVKGIWHANWFDVPANDAMQRFDIELSVQDLKAKWGASLYGSYKVDEKWSYPNISLQGFVQVTPTVRLNASFEDVIPLFTQSERIGCGKYIDRGFSGSVFLKFAL